MKILIAGAPKTGNMWLKNLLSHMYDLPRVDISGVANFSAYLDANYPRFVTHQHFLPKPYILAWGQRVGAHFITLARHPGDLFISLYFYVNHFAETWREEGSLGNTPSHQMIGEPLESQAVFDFLENHFHGECLAKTMAWADSGVAQCLRYEDLKQEPVATLKGLAQALGAVSALRVRRAIRKSHFRAMRRMAGPEMKHHFREGKSGGWQDWLQPSHCDILKEVCSDAIDRWDYCFEAQVKPKFCLAKWW